LIKSALGEEILSSSLNEMKPASCATLKFFQFSSGKVKEIKGINALTNHPNILDFGMNFKQGDTIDLPTDDRSRHGYIILKANSIAELNTIKEWAKEKVKIEYE